jgi:hypothetical protein
MADGPPTTAAAVENVRGTGDRLKEKTMSDQEVFSF